MTLRYVLLEGCKIPAALPQYGLATRAVLGHLGVGLEEPELSCCGYPHRHLSFPAFLLLAARNLALAEERGLDILTPCKCCYGSLRHAAHFLRGDPDLARGVGRELEKEGLGWSGRAGVKHLLTVLARDVGLEALSSRVSAPLYGLRVAAHYGCHALRPSDVVELDNPLAPTLFESLVALTGAEPVDWPRRLDCCGNPLHDTNLHLATRLSRIKIEDAMQSGAACLCTACPYCQIQLEAAQESLEAAGLLPERLAVVLYPQLLGLSLGLSPRDLGMERHLVEGGAQGG